MNIQTLATKLLFKLPKPILSSLMRSMPKTKKENSEIPWHLKGNQAPVKEELTVKDLEINGEIPKELDGMYVWYYKDKMIRLKGNYKGGKNDGSWIWYDENGDITSEKIYEEGRCVEGDC